MSAGVKGYNFYSFDKYINFSLESFDFKDNNNSENSISLDVKELILELEEQCEPSENENWCYLGKSIEEIPNFVIQPWAAGNLGASYTRVITDDELP